MINTVLTPAVPPVELFTVTQLAANLRLITDESVAYTGPEAQLLERLIVAAREAAEDYCHRPFIAKDHELLFKGWDVCIPYFTADHASAVITYVDEAGDPKTLSPADYTWQPSPHSWELTFNSTAVLPVLFGVSSYPVTVAVSIGPGTVKQKVIQAMILIASYWYEHREAGVFSGSGGVKEVPLGFKHLLDFESRRDPFA